MTPLQVQGLLTIATAVVEAVHETGEDGAPSGMLYAALMEHGLSLREFEVLMEALVAAGKLRKSGHVYYAMEG